MREGRAEYCHSVCRPSFDKKGEPTPCDNGDDCENKSPPLLGDNQDIIDLCLHCSTQWRNDGFGRTGMDYNAFIAVAGVFGLEFTPAMLKKIRAVERYEIDRDAKRRKGG